MGGTLKLLREMFSRFLVEAAPRDRFASSQARFAAIVDQHLKADLGASYEDEIDADQGKGATARAMRGLFGAFYSPKEAYDELSTMYDFATGGGFLAQTGGSGYEPCDWRDPNKKIGPRVDVDTNTWDIYERTEHPDAPNYWDRNGVPRNGKKVKAGTRAGGTSSASTGAYDDIEEL